MKLNMFMLTHCPYCKRASRIIDELKESNPKYKEIEIEMINEENDPRASQYDYYYVPTFFLGEEKLYEASKADDDNVMPSKIKSMFDELLSRR